MRIICVFIILIICTLMFFACNDMEVRPDTINTRANETFFLSDSSNLHSAKIKEAFQSYLEEKAPHYIDRFGEYEVYNYIDWWHSLKYELDVFKVASESAYAFYVKQGDDVYPISDYPHTGNISCINHVAITDANCDGNIEIFIADSTFTVNDTYSLSQVKVIDTSTKHVVSMNCYDGVAYFKANKEGIIAIYHTNGKEPTINDVVDDKLDKKYFDLATSLFDAPIRNTAKYEFKQKKLNASCDLFSVDITIYDNVLAFPYLFKKAMTLVAFATYVEMTYLGEPFSYVSGTTHLDCAKISFSNETSVMPCRDTCIGWFALTDYDITPGMVIKHAYNFPEDPNALYDVGVYDMIIVYEHSEVGVYGEIVIEDFLKITR